MLKLISRAKRRIVLLAVVVVAIAAAAAGYAYFTNAGSGTGSATVGTSSAITLSGDATAADLYPGGADVPVTVSIHNPGSGSQYVGTISGSVATNGDCLGSWFQVDDIKYDATIAHGATDTADTAIRMTDSGDNQDACKGQTLTIDWSSN